MMIPGSNIMSSLIWVLSHAMTTTACLLGILLQTYCSYCLRFICLVSKVNKPGGHLRSCAFDISSFKIWSGHPHSARARWIMACKTASGVEIIPPQRVTRALGSPAAQRTISSSWIWFVTVLVEEDCAMLGAWEVAFAGVEAELFEEDADVDAAELSRPNPEAVGINRRFLTKSLSRLISLLCSASWYLQSFKSCWTSLSFWSCARTTVLKIVKRSGKVLFASIQELNNKVIPELSDAIVFFHFIFRHI